MPCAAACLADIWLRRFVRVAFAGGQHVAAGLHACHPRVGRSGSHSPAPPRDFFSLCRPFFPAYLTADRIRRAKKLKLALTAGIGSGWVPNELPTHSWRRPAPVWRQALVGRLSQASL